MTDRRQDPACKRAAQPFQGIPPGDLGAIGVGQGDADTEPGCPCSSTLRFRHSRLRSGISRVATSYITDLSAQSADEVAGQIAPRAVCCLGVAPVLSDAR